MEKITLEALALRVEALEHALAGKRGAKAKNWRRAVGKCRDSKFMRKVDAEGRALREAERIEAQRTERGQ